MITCAAAILTPNMPPPEGTRLAAFAGAEISSIRSQNSDGLLSNASLFAREHRVFLASDLLILEHQLCMVLFDDGGQLILKQPAAHLNHSWAGDLRRGDEIKVASTPLGTISLCVDIDIYKSEVPRIAALQGAEIIISTQYIHVRDYQRGMILAGAWQQAQQNCLYILNSTNHGSSIIGPCEFAPDRSGFLTGISSQYPLAAELSAEKRNAAYQSFPVFLSLNPDLYHAHAGELCK